MMKVSWTSGDVETHLATIRVAIDKDSPFCGMIDLRGLLSLPLPLQHAIHDRMTVAERDRMAEVYGPGAKRARG
jgi:hypothetical protein